MEDKIKDIIGQIMIDNGDQELLKSYSNDSNLKDDLGLDSFSLALMTVQIEDEFGIDVFSDGNYIPKTVKDIINYLNVLL
mgnify:CR=1 FL=1